MSKRVQERARERESVCVRERESVCERESEIATVPPARAEAEQPVSESARERARE